MLFYLALSVSLITALSPSASALLLISIGMYFMSYVSYQDMVLEAAAKAAEQAKADAEAQVRFNGGAFQLAQRLVVLWSSLRIWRVSRLL